MTQNTKRPHRPFHVLSPFTSRQNHSNEPVLKRRQISPNSHRNTCLVRGGSSTGATEGGSQSSLVSKCVDFAASFWAVGGLSYILLKAVKRLVPIALEPFKTGDAAAAIVPLTHFQLGAYIATCLFFVYVEGYKGFQRKFAPLVVVRSMKLAPVSASKIHHVIFGPLYAMGLFHASKKRKIVSWSVVFGVQAIVAVVKRLSYPWRSIVDAGVVAALCWGTGSILIGYVKALIWGVDEGVNPHFPEAKQ
eukprot:CAMPEP_0172508616 /NCGR_PEP_ID=MMETSP1066-20121228/213328_1 /TAXON_ID=671091 /ORGANISM="Coscinodiscus wailesii, Strain CCMP2513" /LENGTH=247 /DNA_ID=CAMNT_0013286665 /DNA_START=168 /DNA_END=911 /DNA_ORIENTATION=+